MLEKIRELDAEVPFIFTTVLKKEDYLLKAIELDVKHYIIKPIELKDELDA